MRAWRVAVRIKMKYLADYLAQVGTHHIIVVMATYHDCSLPEIYL
jgi:hypothetical protein